MNKYEVLRNGSLVGGGEEVEEGPEQIFDFLNEPIEKANNETLPRVAREPKRPWIIHDILLLMQKRRGYKGRNEERYRKLNRRIKRKSLNAKTAWMDNAYEKIEDLDSRDQTRMYSKVKK